MDLKTIDWKETAKEAFAEVLSDMKSDATELIKTQILPGIKAAKDDLVNDLKAEASNSASAWVKIRNAGIIIVVNIVCAVGSKVVDKLTVDNTATTTTTPAVATPPAQQ